MKTAVNNHNESVLYSKEEENNRRKCNSIIDGEWPLKQNCVALRDLVPFAQFKKREKHP